MGIIKHLISFFLILFLFVSCGKDKNIDSEKPQVDVGFSDAFPKNCDTLYFGETYILKVRFTDNIELGSFSIDIHNNFDHHSHSTEVNECVPDPFKEPENPFVFIDDYLIPEGLSEYTTELTIELPDKNNSGNFDEGDYHFFISLTDKEGWSAPLGLSIKMLHR